MKTGFNYSPPFYRRVEFDVADSESGLVKCGPNIFYIPENHRVTDELTVQQLKDRYGDRIANLLLDDAPCSERNNMALVVDFD